jgi:hypothetical protein
LKVLNITCNGETTTCHDSHRAEYPQMVSMLHQPNNHILIMKGDYNSKGSIKKSAWSIAEENKLDTEFKAKMKLVYEKEFV